MSLIQETLRSAAEAINLATRMLIATGSESPGMADLFHDPRWRSAESSSPR